MKNKHRANNGKFSHMILKQLDLTMEIIVMIVKGIITVASRMQGNSVELQARRCRSMELRAFENRRVSESFLLGA